MVVPGQHDHIVHWRKGAELTFGFSELEAMGSPPSLLFALSNADCEHDARALALGDGTCEAVRRHKDGEQIHVVITMGERGKDLVVICRRT